MYLIENPIKLLEELKDILALEFDHLKLPDCHYLMTSSNKIVPDTLSVTGALVYHKSNKTMDSFDIISQSDDNYIALTLTDEFKHHMFKLAMIEDLYQGNEYRSVMDYLLVHCTINIDALPESVTMDVHSGVDAYTEIEFTTNNPHNHFCDLLVCHLDNYESKSDNSYPRFLDRIDLLILFIQKYCKYYPS